MKCVSKYSSIDRFLLQNHAWVRCIQSVGHFNVNLQKLTDTSLDSISILQLTFKATTCFILASCQKAISTIQDIKKLTLFFYFCGGQIFLIFSATMMYWWSNVEVAVKSNCLPAASDIKKYVKDVNLCCLSLYNLCYCFRKYSYFKLNMFVYICEMVF